MRNYTKKETLLILTELYNFKGNLSNLGQKLKEIQIPINSDTIDRIAQQQLKLKRQLQKNVDSRIFQNEYTTIKLKMQTDFIFTHLADCDENPTFKSADLKRDLQFLDMNKHTTDALQFAKFVSLRRAIDECDYTNYIWSF